MNKMSSEAKSISTGVKRLSTGIKSTWCPGCGNFAILNAAISTLSSLEEEGFSLDDVVILSGIGCHAKIADYINVNSFYTIHGRTLPVATGIKLANPHLKVICFAGDGDCYAEGLDHLIFASKRNIDITLIVHNNRVYGLTTGQYTPTSPLGFTGKSTPKGTYEPPINPLELVMSSGASFVARGYTHGLELLTRIFREAVLHRGFSFVDVLQVCATFFNRYDYYNDRVYELEDHDPTSYDAAMKKAHEWDYSSDAKIALGTFYKVEKPVFDDAYSALDPGRVDMGAELKRALESYI